MKLNWYLEKLELNSNNLIKIPSASEATNLEGNLGNLFPTLLKFNG